MKFIKPLILSLLILFISPIWGNADTSEDTAKEAMNEAIMAIGNKDFEKACELLGPLADNNNLSAKTYLGTLYFKGQGVEADVNKGLAMIMDAAKQGFEQAKHIATALNMELAQLGDTKAMYNVGYMCLNGWGGEEKVDPAKCIDWLEIAAQNGHARSAKVLSQIYSKGKFGVARDEEKADYYSNLVQE